MILLIETSHSLLFLEERESLKFKLSGAKDYDTLDAKGAPSKNAEDNLGSWGHEFVRSLAGEIGQEYNQRVIDGADPESDEPFQDLLTMVHVIVPFHLTHNAEAEAVDLLIEVQRLKFLLELDSIDENNYKRICLYLVKTSSYMSDPDDLEVRKSIFDDVSAIANLVLICAPFNDLNPITLLDLYRKCLKQRMRSFENRNNISMHYWSY